MNEIVFVYAKQGSDILFTLAFPLGWIFAWRARAKGAGNFLWICYFFCLFLATLAFFAGNPTWDFGDRFADGLFAGDQSPYAEIRELFGGRGRGMSYRVSRFISQIATIQLIGLVFFAFTAWTWSVGLDRRWPLRMLLLCVLIVGSFIAYGYSNLFQSLFVVTLIAFFLHRAKKRRERVLDKPAD